MFENVLVWMLDVFFSFSVVFCVIVRFKLWLMMIICLMFVSVVMVCD